MEKSFFPFVSCQFFPLLPNPTEVLFSLTVYFILVFCCECVLIEIPPIFVDKGPKAQIKNDVPVAS